VVEKTDKMDKTDSVLDSKDKENLRDYPYTNCLDKLERSKNPFMVAAFKASKYFGKTKDCFKDFDDFMYGG